VASPAITAPGLTTLSFGAADIAGNREPTRRESVLAGPADDGLTYACAAPTPTFSVPAHGTLAVAGTVTVNAARFPFSTTIGF
jgi:hypothetical protein